MARCSSGLNGSTSSSSVGADLRLYVQPAIGLFSINSSSTATVSAERRQLWMLLSVLLLVSKVSSHYLIIFRFKSTIM